MCHSGSRPHRLDANGVPLGTTPSWTKGLRWAWDMLLPACQPRTSSLNNLQLLVTNTVRAPSLPRTPPTSTPCTTFEHTEFVNWTPPYSFPGLTTSSSRALHFVPCGRVIRQHRFPYALHSYLLLLTCLFLPFTDDAHTAALPRFLRIQLTPRLPHLRQLRAGSAAARTRVSERC